MAFVLLAVTAAVSLEVGVKYTGPEGTFCTSADQRTSGCAQSWHQTLARTVVLVGGHTPEVAVRSEPVLLVSRVAAALCLAMLLWPVARGFRLRRRTVSSPGGP